MGLFTRPDPVLPLTDADRRAVLGVVTSITALAEAQPTPQGRLHLALPSWKCRTVLRAVRAAGYQAHQGTDEQIVVTGVHPTPGTATVAEIDARIDQLYALRAEAEAANRLAPHTPA